MIDSPAIPEDRTQRLIEILSRIPQGTRDHCSTIHIHTDGGINISSISRLLSGRTMKILDYPIHTSHHKRHILFQRVQDVLHIDLF